MLLAQELDIELESAEVRQAPIDPTRYDHLTVGSSSIESLWHPLRVAAARARTAFIRAAAARWQRGLRHRRAPAAAASRRGGALPGAVRALARLRCGRGARAARGAGSLRPRTRRRRVRFCRARSSQTRRFHG
jgi:CO/xanthine dehydrogenase Mo-binding subunit